MLSFATQLSLIRAGCRTKSDVDHASPGTVAALPGKAPHEVAGTAAQTSGKIVGGCARLFDASCATAGWMQDSGRRGCAEARSDRGTPRRGAERRRSTWRFSRRLAGSRSTGILCDATSPLWLKAAAARSETWIA